MLPDISKNISWTRTKFLVSPRHPAAPCLPRSSHHLGTCARRVGSSAFKNAPWPLAPVSRDVTSAATWAATLAWVTPPNPLGSPGAARPPQGSLLRFAHDPGLFSFLECPGVEPFHQVPSHSEFIPARSLALSLSLPPLHIAGRRRRGGRGGGRRGRQARRAGRGRRGATAAVEEGSRGGRGGPAVQRR